VKDLCPGPAGYFSYFRTALRFTYWPLVLFEIGLFQPPPGGWSPYFFGNGVSPFQCVGKTVLVAKRRGRKRPKGFPVRVCSNKQTNKQTNAHTASTSSLALLLLVLCVSPTTSFVPSSPRPRVQRPASGHFTEDISRRPAPRERLAFPSSVPLGSQPALSPRCPEQLISRAVAYGTKEFLGRHVPRRW